jgi:predicted flap endonuclease-1-like 5' DNA nuclease
MKPLFTFVLGLVAGWLIEWLIDHSYWRRHYAKSNATYRDHSVQVDKSPLPAEKKADARPAVKAPPDDLKAIKGIGPVIERKLNEVGIYTFEQLGSLTPAGLRQMLGSVIERLANEESLLQQARDLARKA